MDARDLFLVLSDRNRVRILEVLKGGEKTVTDLTRATRLRQPLVSHHLKVLRDAGLVEGRREGRFRLYRAAGGDVAKHLLRVEEGALALQAAVEAGREGAGREGAGREGAGREGAGRGRAGRERASHEGAVGPAAAGGNGGAPAARPRRPGRAP